VNALTVTVGGRCPCSANSLPHTWQPGDSGDLVSFDAPDHGVPVYLGWCCFCAVALLAVVPLSTDLRGGPFIEVPGAQL
jgi:hypothetical protein